MNIETDIDTVVNAHVDRRLLQARQDRWAAELDRAFFSTAAPISGNDTPVAGRALDIASASSSYANSTVLSNSHAALTHGMQGGSSEASLQTNQYREPHADNAGNDRVTADERGYGRVPGAPHKYANTVGASHASIVSAANAATGASAIHSDRSDRPLAIASVSPGAMLFEGDPAMAVFLPAGTSGERLTGQEGESTPVEDSPLWANDAPSSRADSQGSLGDAETYAQRLLHIYQEQGQVRAWIRDAALGPAQIAAVAQALAVQMGTQGVRLSALTVNGRAIPLDRPANMEDGFTKSVEFIPGADAPDTPQGKQ